VLLEPSVRQVRWASRLGPDLFAYSEM